MNKFLNISFSIPLNSKVFLAVQKLIKKSEKYILFIILSLISVYAFTVYLLNGLGLSYNDARSHLDIGRRVVEGLKPGVAQLGSVWLPLPHLLMISTVWNDFMWHTGLSGAIVSMASFVFTGILVYFYLRKLRVGLLGCLVGVFVFVANMNVLYMQSTAMTELLLMFTMTAAAYDLLVWFQKNTLLNLIKAAFFIMLATLVRYDGWFLFLTSAFVITSYSFKKAGYKAAEARLLFFSTLAGLGIALWFLWNLLIFKDPLYFIFGPYSAYTQQQQLAHAGVLSTKGNILFSLQVYLYALAYNSNTFILSLAGIGSLVFFLDRKTRGKEKIASLALLSPLLFNILALYMGQSVLFIQGLSGNTWFNARYGLVLMPAIAVFTGYLIHKSGKLKLVLLGLILMVTFFTFVSHDAVTIDDARVGASQKNVSEVSGWLNAHAKNTDGFILISAASHDAIIFSSGLPMNKFIHEGTGLYWISATSSPDRWARWIVMRTNDANDSTFKLLMNNKGLSRYTLVAKYPFADIYELKPEYVKNLNTKPVLGKQK